MDAGHPPPRPRGQRPRGLRAARSLLPGLHRMCLNSAFVFFRQTNKKRQKRLCLKETGAPAQVTEMNTAPASGGPGAPLRSSFTWNSPLSSARPRGPGQPPGRRRETRKSKSRLCGFDRTALGSARVHVSNHSCCTHLGTRLARFGYLIFLAFYMRIIFKVL